MATNARGGGAADPAASGEAEVSRICDPVYRRHHFQPKGKVLIEVGCGKGGVSRALARRFGLVVGLDASASAVEEASSACADVPNVRFAADVDRVLGVAPGESIDFCFSHGGEPSSARTLDCLREFGRVLRPGGLAHVRIDEEKALTLAGVPLPRLLARMVAAPRVTLREVERAVRAAGLKTVELMRDRSGHTWLLARKPWK